MSRFEIHGSNDITSLLIAKKCTLSGALIFAAEILECWDDVFICEYPETADTSKEPFLIVARLSPKGLL